MDVEAFLQGVIRFSNFITSRLIVSGVVFYVLAGFIDLGSSSEGFLPDIELVNEVVQNYQSIFDTLGVQDFALLLILFVFMTTIHIVYVIFDKVGGYLPPAIVPLSGWEANDDVTLTAFDLLREARGEEHTDEENQRLYEFKKKLREIEQTVEARFTDEESGIQAAYRICKAFVLFSGGAVLIEFVSGNYTGDLSILWAIVGLSAVGAVYTAFALFRVNYERITTIRHDVIVQFLEFSRIWAPQDFQKRIEAACRPSRDLTPARFAVLVPVFGTLDDLKGEWQRWKRRRGARHG